MIFKIYENGHDVMDVLLVTLLVAVSLTVVSQEEVRPSDV